MHCLSALQELDIKYCILTPRSALPPSLQALQLTCYAELSDLSTLFRPLQPGLPQAQPLQLTSMTLSGLADPEPQLTSLRGLEAASGLRSMRLSNLFHLSDVAAMALLTALTELRIGGCKALRTLPSGLGGLSQLEVLKMFRMPSLSIIQELNRLVSLRTLIIQSKGELSVPHGPRLCKKLQN